MQATANTVVVTAQPQPAVHTTVYQSGNSEYGLPAIIFAVAITVCVLSLGCWWAIVCSGIAIALGVGASSSASAGDMQTAKQYNSGSIVLTVFAVISAIVPFIALIVWVISISNNNRD
jgi:hypothetical protein